MERLKQLWEKYVSSAESTFRFTKEEREGLNSSNLARFVSLLPTIAECDSAERAGFSNLCLYIAERTGGKNFFLHTEDNDKELLDRLAPFKQNMQGGNPQILEAGLARLGLVMLRDYKTDCEEDAKKGKYNPLNTKAWTFKDAEKALLDQATQVKNAAMDELFAVDAAPSWWDK